MRARLFFLRTVAVALVSLWAVGHFGTALAIDFRCPIAPDPECDQWIFISGVFWPGDATRFQDEVRRRGPEIRTVALWRSSGGDAIEAMEIGRLIRKLRMTTTVSRGRAGVPPSLAVDVNGTMGRISTVEARCAGACFLVWVAGMERDGNYRLIIRRPYFADERFEGLDETTRLRKEQELRGEVAAYLAEMHVEPSVWLIMRSIRAEDGVTLKPSYLRTEIPPLAPEIATWGMDACGEQQPPLLEIEIPDSMTDDPIFTLQREAFDQFIKGRTCRTSRLETETFEAWTAEFQ
jgi:hypothetical protein